MYNVYLFLLFMLFLIYLNNNYNNYSNYYPMKLVFFGDTMFGRDNHPFVDNPFSQVKSILKDADALFFNLETVISNPPLSEDYKEDKVFNYQSNGRQLLALRKITKKPTFVSIANNHSLDYGVKGHQNTKDFLKSNRFLYNSKQKTESKDIVFLNATDHCGCDNPELWKKHVLMIDYENLDPIYRKIKNLKDRFIVFSIHWGSNWVQDEMPHHIQQFAKNLIDRGVNIVFGHSAHHIVKNPVVKYKKGIIIYGLGDFINDYAVDESYKSNEALMCIIHRKYNHLSYELIHVDRKFVQQGGSIPFLKL